MQKKGEAWQSLVISLVGNMELRAIRPRQLKFTGKHTGKEKATQRENQGDFQKAPLKDAVEHRSEHA